MKIKKKQLIEMLLETHLDGFSYGVDQEENEALWEKSVAIQRVKNIYRAHKLDNLWFK